MNIDNRLKFVPNMTTFEKIKLDDDLKVKKITPEAPSYSIEEILDRVENGDLSILEELNISYTEISDESGHKKISFKYDNVRYTVNIITNSTINNDSDVQDDISQPEDTLEEFYKKRDEYKNKQDEINRQMLSLNVPVPPSANDYVLSDGSFDEEAYKEAERQYLEQCSDYDKQMAEYNKMGLEIQYELQVLDTKIAALEFEDNMSKLQDEIEQLKSSPNSNPELIAELEAMLQFIKDQVSNISDDKMGLLAEMQELHSRINNQVMPTPPQSSDYILSDGTVDEEAFNEVYAKYQQDLNEYNAQRDALQSALSNLYAHLDVLDQKENSINNNDTVLLEKYITEVANLQGILDNTPDNESNRDLIDNLKEMIAELSRNIKEQNDTNNQISDLENAMLNIEIPTPPSVSDFQRVEYSFKLGPINYQIESIKQNGDGTYTAILDDGSSIKCNAELDENGYITKIIILEENGSELEVMLSMNITLDEEAYANAYNNYENQVKELDNTLNSYNSQMDMLANKSDSLKDSADSILVNAYSAVVENKIQEYRSAGNDELADQLEQKLKNYQKELSHVELQKSTAKRREEVLRNRLNNLVVPEPPQTSDYLNKDGTVNEAEYNKAYKDYKAKSNRFDRIQNIINNQLTIVENELTELDKKLNNLQSEIKNLI